MENTQNSIKLTLSHYFLLLLKEGVTSFNRTRLYASCFLFNLFSHSLYFKNKREIDTLSLDIKNYQQMNNITSLNLKDKLSKEFNGEEDLKEIESFRFTLEQVIYFVNSVKNDRELSIATSIIAMADLGLIIPPSPSEDSYVDSIFNNLVSSLILYKTRDGYNLSFNIINKEKRLYKYPAIN